MRLCLHESDCLSDASLTLSRLQLTWHVVCDQSLTSVVRLCVCRVCVC